jgi:hypothetical protein
MLFFMVIAVVVCVLGLELIAMYYLNKSVDES